MMKYLKLTLAIPLLSMASYAYAGPCDGSALTGTLVTESGSIIYLSSESWDLAFPSSPSPITFVTSYDPATPASSFAGSAWSEEFGWLDFDGDTATFRSANATSNPTGYQLWGGWNGSFDLSGIDYTSPSFTGTTNIASNLTGGASNDTDDWYVGSGALDFSNAGISLGAIPGCSPAEVNLFANGNTSYTQTGSCPLTSVSLTWTSTDVSNCTTGSGPWNTTGSKPTSNTSGETQSISVPHASSQVFTLNCEDSTGATVTGTASVSCNNGGVTTPGGGTGNVNPDYLPT